MSCSSCREDSQVLIIIVVIGHSRNVLLHETLVTTFARQHEDNFTRTTFICLTRNTLTDICRCQSLPIYSHNKWSANGSLIHFQGKGECLGLEKLSTPWPVEFIIKWNSCSASNEEDSLMGTWKRNYNEISSFHFQSAKWKLSAKGHMMSFAGDGQWKGCYQPYRNIISRSSSSVTLLID